MGEEAARKHVFLGKHVFRFQRQEIKDLRRMLKSGYWAAHLGGLLNLSHGQQPDYETVLATYPASMRSLHPTKETKRNK
jgi:hypothetical protein